MQIPPMPFKILAIAPFTHQQEAYWSEDPIQVDKTNLDQVMGELGLSFYVPIPIDLCPAGGLGVRDYAGATGRPRHPRGGEHPRQRRAVCPEAAFGRRAQAGRPGAVRRDPGGG